MISDEIKNELITGLHDLFQDKLVCIILYGSVARGDATAESDVDIAVIVSDIIGYEEKQHFFKWNAMMDMKYDKVFSIVDIEKDKLDKWKSVVPFYKNIQKDGVVLWKAA